MSTHTLPTVTPTLQEFYGSDARLCPCANDQLTLVFSQTREFDLVAVSYTHLTLPTNA